MQNDAPVQRIARAVGIGRVFGMDFEGFGHGLYSFYLRQSVLLPMSCAQCVAWAIVHGLIFSYSQCILVRSFSMISGQVVPVHSLTKTCIADSTVSRLN